MRLIDADKLRLVKCGECDNGKPINCVYEWAIKDAPTVKAITIEWIEEWGWKNGMSESMSLRVMIEDWEKENDKGSE